MARRRFFVDEIRGGAAMLDGEEAEHLTRVLRAETGQQFEISDGARLYLGEIVEAHKRSVRFRIMQELEVAEPAVRVALLMSLVRFERFEWAIEKATELGAARIVPVQADRSEKGLDVAARKRAERWRKIARAAGQQSRRVHLPVISPPVEFREAVTDAASNRFYLEETPGCPLLLNAILALPEHQRRPAVAVLVGPEGGWTDRERALLAGWVAVSMGQQILRTETAAIAALAVLVQGW